MSGKTSVTAPEEQVLIGPLTDSDGAALWRMARDSGTLDLNSPYAYLTWCRDFGSSSVIARQRDEPVGFVTGYLRPSAPDTVVVWQVAVGSSQRGKGLAGTLLDELADRLVEQGVRWLETTITADNAASIALFNSFAKRRSASVEVSELFRAEDFPDEHDAEELYRIGPLA